MKRMFALIGFTYLVTLTLFIFISTEYYFVFLSVFVLCGIVSLISRDLRKDKVLPILFLTCIVSSSSYMINYYRYIVPTHDLYNKDLTITGTICEIPYKNNDKFYYIIDVDKIVGERDVRGLKMSISCYEALVADMRDNITVDVHTYPHDDTQYDIFKFYNFSRKIYLSGYLRENSSDEISIVNKTENINYYYYFLNVRKRAMSIYRRMFSEEYSSIINGIIFGDRYNISDTVKNKFIESGIYHIVSVSGMHVTIISQIILYILAKIRVNRRLSYILTSGVIFIFMTISCYSPPVVSAGIMTIIYLLGLAIYRESDSLNSLGIAVLIMCIFNPNLGGSVSLWLSFLSKLGIITLSPKISFWIEKKLKSKNKVIKYILDSESATLSVTVFTLPLNIIIFRRIYLSSIISNILILPFIPILIFNSFICLMFYIVVKVPIWKLVGIINIYIIRYMKYICEVISRISYFKVFLRYDFIGTFLIISTLILAIIFLYDKLRKYIKIVVVSILNIFMILCLYSRFLRIDDVVISVLNTSGTLSVLLQKDNKYTLIYNSGDYPKYKYLYNNLYNVGVDRLDFLIAPNFNINDINVVSGIIDTFGTKHIVIPDKYKFEEEIKFVNNIECKKDLFDSGMKLNMYGIIDINIFKVDSKSYIFLEVYGKKILFFLDGGDVLKLSEEIGDADILICKGLPNKFNKIKNLKDVVICSSIKDYSILEDKIKKYKINSFCTGVSGNVDLRLNKSGTYKIMEENNVQSFI